MANIKKRGDSYRITVSNGRDSTGKQLREYATWTPAPGMTERQAKRALEVFAIQFEEKVKSGRYLSGEKMTYAEFSEIWRREYGEKQLEPTSLERVDIAQKRILPHIGHIRLSALMPLHIQTLYSTIQKEGYTTAKGELKEYNASTIKRYHSVLSSIFSYAVTMGLIDNNPCLRAKPPKEKEDPSEIKCFTADQARAFLEFLDEEYTVAYRGRQKKDGSPSAKHTEIHAVSTQVKAIIYMAMYSGLRRGEFVALKWGDIDYEKGAASIIKSTAYTKALGQFDKGPKKKASVRTVPLSPSVTTLLQQHEREQQEYSLSLGTAWQGNNHVFTQTDGRQINLHTPSHTFKKILDRYNADPHREPLPYISLHGLRHTFTSLMISNGVDPLTTAGLLGHSDTSTTLRIYSHFMKEAGEKAVNVLEDVLSSKKEKTLSKTVEDADARPA
jgi:integrase